METDLDLLQLIATKDHLNVLRYIRIHQLRQPELVVEQGRALLGPNLNSARPKDLVVRRAALEQVCLAALDTTNDDESNGGGGAKLADLCLTRLRESGVEASSTRYRLLLARCLESAGDVAAAEQLYDQLLTENPANGAALQRKYCLLKASVGKTAESAAALNAYLQQNYADTAAWYELAELRREMGDFAGAAFCLEEVLLASPTAAPIHVELAECYVTVGGVERLLAARQHMAQALELEPTNVRAQFGLVVAANAYLQEVAAAVGASSSNASAKAKAAMGGTGTNDRDFDVAVARELVRFGAEQVVASYQQNANGELPVLLPAVEALMAEYREDP